MTMHFGPDNGQTFGSETGPTHPLTRTFRSYLPTFADMSGLFCWCTPSGFLCNRAYLQPKNWPPKFLPSALNFSRVRWLMWWTWSLPQVSRSENCTGEGGAHRWPLLLTSPRSTGKKEGIWTFGWPSGLSAALPFPFWLSQISEIRHQIFGISAIAEDLEGCKYTLMKIYWVFPQ